MLTAVPASHFMGRCGRRAGFLLGAAAGAAGGALAATALLTEQFNLLLAGAAFTGIYQSSQGFFRFAAADTASPEFKPKAISWVLAGGLVSAIIGPEIVRVMADWFAPVPSSALISSAPADSLCSIFLAPLGGAMASRWGGPLP